jgi:hypothetical protein
VWMQPTVGRGRARVRTTARARPLVEVRRRRRVAALAGPLVLWLGACEAAEGPRLVQAQPAAARQGDRVALRGDRLCGPSRATPDGACDPLPSGSVDFGLEPPIVRAPIVTWRDDTIEVLVPAAVDIGATTVYVTVDGRSSNDVPFEVLP